jgi:hypothetical protein
MLVESRKINVKGEGEKDSVCVCNVYMFKTEIERE